MSILNQMHQDFEKTQNAQPVLGGMPNKNNKNKIILVFLVILLIGSSIGLFYLILTQEKNVQQAPLALNTVLVDTSNNEPTNQVSDLAQPTKAIADLPAARPSQASPKIQVNKTAIIAPKTVNKEKTVKKVKPQVEQKKADLSTKEELNKPQEITKNRPSAASNITQEEGDIEQDDNSYLEIKPAQLSASELAHIYLNDADKAEAKGDFKLTANKREQALSVQPDLNEVRKSLALYYHSQGDLKKAQNLLQKGALTSPEYSDFNLMLARIALKEGNEQKAYRYLDQSPPKVERHLDYYVSYAVLALKLQKYAQAESLYNKLLSQNINNGRWKMSLAIAQDKQMKTKLATKNYKNALLQEDLSTNAKDYINQRLSFLDQNKGMQ